MSKKKQNKEPALYEESYMPEAKKRPPYIYLFFIAFVLFTIIWKGVMRQNSAGGNNVQESPTISEREIADHTDKMR